MNTLTKYDILKLLEEIPDPELPIVSIVDLAMVRDIDVNDQSITVSITPTYSGCPATELIFQEVENVIRNAVGPEIKVTVNKVLFPPWTTRWLTASARTKLTTSGVAAPCDNKVETKIPISKRRTPHLNAVKCPRCETTNTTELSRFGTTSCKALYRCDNCLETFEYMKDL